jgi:hypothetical protein
VPKVDDSEKRRLLHEIVKTIRQPASPGSAAQVRAEEAAIKLAADVLDDIERVRKAVEDIADALNRLAS